eukprot:CAMPEP_0113483454 /NCGR_PEP_ID=MMETSP0014_2-20120614/23441_1 /TAXON_ID=2857 /ORGANISM="Nitzschia sp." /LENGTH=1048 /DNA_ID=CAMNT_0000376999 /DNA_START=73 /DNA_END=3219 /DNA_ORIENTATION=- /assembly_acc=CAM_ASM_000159
MSSTESSAPSVGGAVFVEVETVNEDDDDDTSINSGTSTASSASDVVDGGHPPPPKKQHGQRQEEFEDEVVLVAKGNRNGRGARNTFHPNSMAAPTATAITSSTSGFIPDPDEWLNVVNSAADTFMGASSGAGAAAGGGGGDNIDDNNNDDDGSLLPHPDEVKLETTRNSTTTGRANFDEPDHATPFVNVADDDADGGGGVGGRASLPHPDHLMSTNHQMFVVNSTSHAASLPHVDEVKTEKRDKDKNMEDGGVDHFDVFQMNTVGVDSLPSTAQEVVGGVGANHGFNVNSTDHASSLPHVDEIKADPRNNTAVARGTTGGSDEPDQLLDIFQMNTVGVDSLPSNKEEIVGGVGANHGFNVNSTDHAASFPHVDEYKADAPGAIGGTSGDDDDDDDGDDIKLTATGSLFTPNTTAVDSLPQPGHDDGKTFQVNSTGHGASLPHAEEVRASGGTGGKKNNKNKKHSNNNNNKTKKNKKPRNNETNEKISSIGKNNRENDKDGLNLNLTILDYDSDKDPAEKKNRVYGGKDVDDSDNSDDEPDHDTPHAVQSRSGDHSSSLPHPEELQTDTNITKKGGVGGRTSSIAAATSKFFSSFVRVNSKDEDYKEDGDGRNNRRTIISEEDDDADLASSHVGDDDDDPSSSANGESEMTSISATDKKRKKSKKSKKSKKDKRRKKKSSKRHIEDEDDEEDRFTDEPGAQAAVAVTRRRNVDFTIDSDSDDEEENGDVENADINSKALVRYDPSTSQSDGVFLKRSRSSTDGSKPSLRSNSLVQSIRGISSRLGFESNHEPTHRMDDEDHVEFGLSLEDDEDDESFYLKNDAKRHYRTTMIMRHKKTCIIVGLIVLFLALLIPLAILSSEKRKEQLNTVDTSSVASPPTSAPTTAAAPAAPSAAPTLPPVAENCEDRISLAPEMAGRDCYGPDEFINITFSQCYPSPDDWIGLFPSGAVYFGRLWREYYNWIWTCGAEACTEKQVTEDLPIRGKFSTPMLDPGDYQLFIVLDSGWPYLPLVSSEVIRVRTWCSIANDEPESSQSDGVRGRQLRGLWTS